MSLQYYSLHQKLKMPCRGSPDQRSYSIDQWNPCLRHSIKAEYDVDDRVWMICGRNLYSWPHVHLANVASIIIALPATHATGKLCNTGLSVTNLIANWRHNFHALTATLATADDTDFAGYNNDIRFQ